MNKVSVIITTYKRSEFLERAVQSVLNQTYQNYEIIVVDDNNANSSYREETKKRMAPFLNSPKVKYIKHDINKNGACARNTGIKNATGDFITFLDDDDVYLPTRIEKTIRCLKNTPDDVIGCYTGMVYMQHKKVIGFCLPKGDGDFTLELLKQESVFGTGSNFVLKSDIIKKVGFFDERFIRHQDLEYLIRCFQYGKLKAINKILVIKNVDSRMNVPNYNKMEYVKNLFLNKFKYIIDKYPINVQNDIYFINYFELYCSKHGSKKEYRDLKRKLIMYKKIGLKNMIVRFIKLHFYNNLFFNYVVFFLKRINSVFKCKRNNINLSYLENIVKKG